MRQSLEPLEPSRQPVISRPQAEQNIRLALSRIGVGFADASNIVCYDPGASTAFWWINRTTGEERIHVGPLVASLEIPCVEVILRHEILHRSIFGFRIGMRDTNHSLANLVTDICINVLLHKAHPVAMRAASVAIYPAESKTTPIALADCSADPALLPEQLRTLWGWIWNDDGGGSSLNPASLYYQLLRISDGHDSAGGDSMAPTAIPRQSMQRAIDRVLQDLNARLPHGSALASALSTYTVSPVTIGSSAVEAFVRSMRIRTTTSTVAKLLSSHFAGPSRLQAYPMIPSRIGLVYLSLGISQATGLFWNRTNDSTGERLALGVYVDVSGSMVKNFPLVVSIVRSLVAYVVSFFVFDSTVREVDVDALSAGSIIGGGGTSFDAVLEHFVAHPQLAGAMLITDGEAGVSDHVGDVLRRSGRPLFVIYLRSKGNRAQDTLANYATRTLELPPQEANV